VATRAGTAIVAGGLAAGVLDILAAFALAGSRGGSPVRVLQFIASGVLGAGAFQGGAPVAALGLFLHFVIATGAAAVFVAASRIWPRLTREAIVAGSLYGVAVWLVMNQVVVPLSRVAQRPPAPGAMALMIGIHVVCVGLPIALAARRYAGPPGMRS
jgi:Na+/proline symporter